MSAPRPPTWPEWLDLCGWLTVIGTGVGLLMGWWGRSMVGAWVVGLAGVAVVIGQWMRGRG